MAEQDCTPTGTGSSGSSPASRTRTASPATRARSGPSSARSSTGFVDECYEDRMGNLIAVRRGDDFRVMLASHMDEIGFMVKYVEKEGFLRFAPIGGWFPPMLAGQRAVLHGDERPGHGRARLEAAARDGRR